MTRLIGKPLRLNCLVFQIVQKSPPVEDIPRNIPKCVRDLIERGFTVCQGQRPIPEDLLRHEAFKLITGKSSFFLATERQHTSR